MKSADHMPMPRRGLAAALAFVQLVQGRPDLQAQMLLNDATDTRWLLAFARQHGFELTPVELYDAFVADWRMRRAHFGRDDAC